MPGRKTRKLLTAAVGVATVSYVASCARTATRADTDGRQLNADQSTDEVAGNGTTLSEDTTFDPGEQTVISGNLVAPPPVDETLPMPNDSAIISGNLVAPPAETTEPEVTIQPPVDSSFIAGNLLPPPSNWQLSTEPPAVTDQTAGPGTTVPPATGAPDPTDGLSSAEVGATVQPPSTEPPSVTEQPDAQAPPTDASVTDGEQSQ
jgi:hypothetical protein